MAGPKFSFRTFFSLVTVGLLAFGGFRGWQYYEKWTKEKEILNAMIMRLEADSRIAEVIVSSAEFNPVTQQTVTTIKFLEYDSGGNPMLPKYFTFDGNIIQFQSLVVRFDDMLVKSADRLRGKSAYLFWKVFILDGVKTQEYEITPIDTVPQGYRIDGPRTEFEKELWKDFWDFALNSDRAIKRGIKNAQIEAPGTKFVTGYLYTLKIEHDGGIRIDVEKIPDVLRGEKIN